MSSKSKKPKPSPAQQQLEQLQLQELQRARKEEEQLKAFTGARRSRAGRRSLVATSGAGTKADFRIGPDGRKAVEREDSLINALGGADLEKELRRRGAIGTRRIGGSTGRFTPFGFQRPTRGTSITTIDFNKL